MQCCKIKLISFFKLSFLSLFQLANVHPKHCCVYSGPYYWLGCCDERGVLLNGSYLSWHSPSVLGIPKCRQGSAQLGDFSGWIPKRECYRIKFHGNEANSMLLKSRVFLVPSQIEFRDKTQRVQESKVRTY